MRHTYQSLQQAAGQLGRPGIWLLCEHQDAVQVDLARLREWLATLGALPFLSIHPQDAKGIHFLHVQANRSVPVLSDLVDRVDTLGIAAALELDSLHRDDHLALEIVVSLAMSPIVFPFPSLSELQSSVNMRTRIARAANQAELAFDTEGIERPAQYWHYHESTGFILMPGQDLVEALIHTTHPPMRRSAAASWLTPGTILRAMGTSPM